VRETKGKREEKKKVRDLERRGKRAESWY